MFLCAQFQQVRDDSIEHESLRRLLRCRQEIRRGGPEILNARTNASPIVPFFFLPLDPLR